MLDGVELVSGIAGRAAAHAIRAARMGELSDIGQLDTLINEEVTKYLSKFGPDISAKLLALAEPAAKKAAEVVRPQVEEALAKYMPQFASIAGGLMGLAVLLGIWISKTSRGENI